MLVYEVEKQQQQKTITKKNKTKQKAKKMGSLISIHRVRFDFR